MAFEDPFLSAEPAELAGIEEVLPELAETHSSPGLILGLLAGSLVLIGFIVGLLAGRSGSSEK